MVAAAAAGQAGAHIESALGRAGEFEFSVQLGDALAHADQAVASGRRMPAEAAAIVDDLDLDLVVAYAEPYLDAGGVGVAGDVGQASWTMRRMVSSRASVTCSPSASIVQSTRMSP